MFLRPSLERQFDMGCCSKLMKYFYSAELDFCGIFSRLDTE